MTTPDGTHAAYIQKQLGKYSSTVRLPTHPVPLPIRGAQGRELPLAAIGLWVAVTFQQAPGALLVHPRVCVRARVHVVQHDYQRRLRLPQEAPQQLLSALRERTECVLNICDLKLPLCRRAIVPYHTVLLYGSGSVQKRLAKSVDQFMYVAFFPADLSVSS